MTPVKSVVGQLWLLCKIRKRKRRGGFVYIASILRRRKNMVVYEETNNNDSKKSTVHMPCIKCGTINTFSIPVDSVKCLRCGEEILIEEGVGE
jgi:ribosomal protein S27E